MNVIFEGLPGAGKSTTINLIKNTWTGKKVVVLSEFMENVQGDKRDIEYFLANEEMKYNIMKQSHDDLCLCDRFWQSTLVYNAVSCNANTLDELRSLYRIIYKDKVFKEDVYVYLYVPSYVSLARHTNVGEDECLWFNSTFNKKAERIYDLLYHNIEMFRPSLKLKIKVDTHTNDLHSTEKLITSFLKKIDNY